MCDGRDKDQELLEKLSRQLSELTSTGNTPINEVLVGSHWAQSSGLPSEEPPSSFSPLYTWDPSFLPASPRGTSPHLSNPGFHPQDSPTASAFPFPPPNHNLTGNIEPWGPSALCPPQEFNVIGDLSGRFSNVPKSHSSQQQDNNLIGSSHKLHQSNTPIVGRNFVSDQSNQLFSSLSSVIGSRSPSFNTHHKGFDLHTASTNSHHSHHRDHFDNFHNTVSPDLPNPSSFFDSPHPSFDPTTPPPYPFQRQLSDASDQLSTSESLAAPNEFLDYLRLHSQPDVELDIGTGIDGSGDSWQKTVKTKDITTSNEGKQLYAEALSKWNSFDFTGIDTSESTDDFISPANVAEVSTPVESLSQAETTKPSYLDIAKTPKVTSAPSRPETGWYETSTKTQFISKDGKPYRPLIQRTISASKFWPKGNSEGSVSQPAVPPTSRYGLDSFEDDHIRGKNSESVGNISKTNRSASCTGVFDNLSAKMTGQDINGGDVAALGENCEDKSSQKLKTDVTDAQIKSTTKTSATASPTPKSEEKLYFDPKRIFQPKNTNKSRAQSPTQKVIGKTNVNDKYHPGETVLNNGKPTTPSSSIKLPTAARQHDYINNDLRDANKETNKTAAESLYSSYGKSDEQPRTKQKESSRPASGKHSGTGRVNGSFHREKRKTSGDDSNFEYPAAQNGQRIFPGNVDMDKLREWFYMIWEKLIVLGHFLLANGRSFLIYTLGLALFLTCGAYRLLHFLVMKGWTVIMNKISSRFGKNPEETGWKSRESVRRRVGMEENITMPTTGEEAMKRLLACKGKDPYSILGVRQDSSDEDIKKYYRKQAVLVHPDKNQEPGAEEAFKILGHAFEKIGEPTKRKEYDNQALVESESELRQEFADLISKLQTKIQEAANMMPCDKCSKKHRRVPVDRPFYSARFCEKCNIRHPAKEGDVWAETTMLGFYWNYYALMEGNVYDITEWMKCHDFYKQMRANEHQVLTRIATDGNKKTKHNHSRESNLEDLINRFFPKPAGHAAGASSSQANGSQPHSGAEWGQGSFSGSAATSATSRKAGGRRKKKRH